MSGGIQQHSESSEEVSTLNYGAQDQQYQLEMVSLVYYTYNYGIVETTPLFVYMWVMIYLSSFYSIFKIWWA